MGRGLRVIAGVLFGWVAGEGLWFVVIRPILFSLHLSESDTLGTGLLLAFGSPLVGAVAGGLIAFRAGTT